MGMRLHTGNSDQVPRLSFSNSYTTTYEYLYIVIGKATALQEGPPSRTSILPQPQQYFVFYALCCYKNLKLIISDFHLVKIFIPFFFSFLFRT